MKKLIAILSLVIGSLDCSAQSNAPPPGPSCPTAGCVSPNLVYTTLNSYNAPPGTTVPYTWSGFTNTVSTGGGTSGGNQPGYNATTGTFMFGYTTGTINYNYAVSQALKSSGMTWMGYNYSWDYINQDSTKGTLAAKVVFNSIGGSALHTKNWTLGATTEGWTTMSGTETFTNPLAVANINSFDMSFTGKDSKFWAGYYGPQVKNLSLKINYTFDACSTNPLSSTTCPGYAEAYKTQQCTANPLYDPTCPGYAVALRTQQCTINPLSDPTCPNYQTYLNEQCLKDSLFSTLCEGYKTAYAIKYIVNLDPAVTTAVNQQLTTNNEIAKTDPTKITVVNTTVDSVLTTPSTTSATSISPGSVVSVIAPPTTLSGISPTATAVTAAVAPPPPPPAAKQEERAQEQKKTDTEVAKVEKKSGGDTSSARKEVAAKAVEIAKNAGKATTLEAQVAQQGLLVGLIGYVPGFSGYQQAIIPDTLSVEIARAYYKPIIDNRSAQRRLSGANELRWQEMVDSQYK